MSYCRFEGTLGELRRCLDVVGEHLNEEAEYPVSENEIACFHYMVREFFDFLKDADLIDDEGELDRDMLNEICFKLEKARDE